MKNRLLSVSSKTQLVSQISLEAFDIHKMEKRSIVDALTPILIKETINFGVICQEKRGFHEH
jgi:hypothetical protein